MSATAYPDLEISLFGAVDDGLDLRFGGGGDDDSRLWSSWPGETEIVDGV